MIVSDNQIYSKLKDHDVPDEMIVYTSLDQKEPKKELGFESTFSLEEGIRKTVNWYKINKMI